MAFVTKRQEFKFRAVRAMQTAILKWGDENYKARLFICLSLCCWCHETKLNI